MNKLEIGMYVRTDKTGIKKIYKIDNNKTKYKYLYKLKEHLKNRYDNGTESISYRQVFMEIREAMQALEMQQKLEKREW